MPSIMAVCSALCWQVIQEWGEGGEAGEGGRKVGRRPNESEGGVGETEKRVVFFLLNLQIDRPHLIDVGCYQ